jgi:hypothetical protein
LFFILNDNENHSHLQTKRCFMVSIPPESSTLKIGSRNAELVVGSTLFLMSSYARGEQPAQLQKIICKHLESLADREDLSGVLRQLCDQLAIEWQTPPMAKKAVATKPKGWLRLVRNDRLS